MTCFLIHHFIMWIRLPRFLFLRNTQSADDFAMPLDDCPPPYSRLSTGRSPVPSKSLILKFVFIGTAVSASIILLSGIILGGISLDGKKIQKYSVAAGILTLLGVIMLIATVPCCFYFWFRVGRDTSNISRCSSRRSSLNEIDRPTFVSDLYPEEFRVPCAACLEGECRSRHSELPPPYDAPPPYTPSVEAEAAPQSGSLRPPSY